MIQLIKSLPRFPVELLFAYVRGRCIIVAFAGIGGLRLVPDRQSDAHEDHDENENHDPDRLHKIQHLLSALGAEARAEAIAEHLDGHKHKLQMCKLAEDRECLPRMEGASFWCGNGGRQLATWSREFTAYNELDVSSCFATKTLRCKLFHRAVPN